MVSPSDDDADEPWDKGPVFSTRDGDTDESYVDVLPHEIDGRGVDWPTIDLEEWKAKLEVFEITVDGAISDVHLHWETEPDEGPTSHAQWGTVTVPSVAPMVATVGSATFHGGPLGPGPGSTNVYVEGKPVWRMGRDAHLCTLATPMPHGGGVVAPMGPPSGVFVNGFPIARAGDAVMELLGGPNPILMGATTVYAGPPAGPVTSIDPVPTIVTEEDPWYRRLRKWVVDVDAEASVEVKVLPGGGKVTGGAEADLDDELVGGNVRVDGSGELVHGKARAKVNVELFGGLIEFDAVDWEDEGGAGKWKGYLDIVVDPVTKRPRIDGDVDLGEEG
jgi:uncharacterized Zn-binding protein involved in type VI secretion